LNFFISLPPEFLIVLKDNPELLPIKPYTIINDTIHYSECQTIILIFI